MATIRGDNNPNFLKGDDEDDVIIGFGGNDILDGDAGNDRLYGGFGNDRLEGGSGPGTDLLYGGAGNDLLEGDGGTDILFGGTGRDFFKFEAFDGIDRIADFEKGIDHVLFDIPGLQFEDLTIRNNVNGDALVTYGASNATIVLTDIDAATLTRADFIFDL